MTRSVRFIARFTFAALGGCGTGDSVDAPPFVAEDSEAEAAAARREASPPMCRCPEHPLGTYFDRANLVVMGEVLSTTDQDGDRYFQIAAAGRPWKEPGPVEDGIQPGDTLHFVTSTSSASCGLSPSVGGHYLLFAPSMPDSAAPPRIQTCDGSRAVRDDEGLPGPGFLDVPGRFVASQLDALSGLEVLAEITADAPDETNPSNDSLVGLVDIPAFANGGRISVRERPEAVAPVVAEAASFEDLDAREASYEESTAVVLARARGWYRIRLAGGRIGWISPDEAGTWFPYAELPIRRLAYLTAAWSGHVWPEAGAGIPARSRRKGSLPREEYPVEVLESTSVGGMTWFRIEVLDGDPCSGGDVRPELGGWVPAHGAEGAPTVWYYSRGC